MKRFLEKAAYIAFGFAFALTMVYVLDVNWERRFVLYHIRNELKKDMPKAEVEEIINRHQTSFVWKIEKEENIYLWVHLGLTDALSLQLIFSDNKLKSASLAGEDHPKDVPEDAPPNLE